MKKILFIGMILLGLSSLVACNDIDSAKKNDVSQVGTLTVGVNYGTATKASNDDPVGGDATARSIQAIIYDADGNWFSALSLSGGGSSYSGSMDVPVGNYTVAVVANGTAYTSETAATLTVLRGKTVSLGTDGTAVTEAPASGMSRYGEQAVSVTASGGSASVNLDILAFRAMVHNVSLTGVAASRLSITGAFLENVYGTCTLSGTSSNFQNRGGRTDYGVAAGVQPVIGSSTAFGGTLTYYTDNPQNYAHAFYAYPNAASSDQFDGPLASGVAYTRMVLVGTWNSSETVYYPVTIPSTVAGYSYDVNYTITKRGSDDPNKLPEDGGMTASVTVTPWTAGSEISGSF